MSDFTEGLSVLKGFHSRAIWSLNGILVSHIITKSLGCQLKVSQCNVMCKMWGHKRQFVTLRVSLPHPHTLPVLKKSFKFLKCRSVSDQQQDCITRKIFFIFSLEEYTVLRLSRSLPPGF